MELTPEREFRFAERRKAAIGGALGMVGWALCFGWLARVQTQHGIPLIPSPSSWALAAALCAILALWACTVAVSVLWWRNGRVSATGFGLEVRDWRGRERRIHWDEIQELRVRALLPGVPHPRGTLELRGPNDPVYIAEGLGQDGWTWLRDQILAHAGLTESTRRWWGVRYTRPAG